MIVTGCTGGEPATPPSFSPDAVVTESESMAPDGSSSVSETTETAPSDAPTDETETTQGSSQDAESSDANSDDVSTEEAPSSDSDATDDGGIPLPSVDPAPAGDAFCVAYTGYLDAGGPYSLQEVGEELPAFTQEDIDHYAALQSTAPDAIRPTVDQLLSYGREMSQGDFSHGIDYENLLSGPNGLVLWVIPYCQIDMNIA